MKRTLGRSLVQQLQDVGCSSQVKLIKKESKVSTIKTYLFRGKIVKHCRRSVEFNGQVLSEEYLETPCPDFSKARWGQYPTKENILDRWRFECKQITDLFAKNPNSSEFQVVS